MVTLPKIQSGQTKTYLFLVAFSLLIASCTSSSQKVEEACSLVRQIESAFPDYPQFSDPTFLIKKNQFELFWNGGGFMHAPKASEAAEIFRSISLDNPEMAKFAVAANRLANILQYGGTRDDEIEYLLDFCTKS